MKSCAIRFASDDDAIPLNKYLNVVESSNPQVLTEWCLVMV